MKRLKLSVALITYNHELFIGPAIESALGQKVNFDYEIVIGEDCSTDGTRAVVMDYQRRYPDIIRILLRERNIGGFRNMESTLAVCGGQYLAILEGDDYWTRPDKLQKQVDFLDAHPDRAICCHRARCLIEKDFGKACAEPLVFPFLAAGSYTIEDLLRQNFIMTCSAVLRRDVMASLPPPFSKIKAGDWPRYVLAAKNGKIELMDDVMAVYRLHRGGAWSAASRLGQVEDCAQMFKTLDKHLGFEYKNTIRKTLAGFYLEMAAIVRQEGKRAETAKHIISYVRSRGWHLSDCRLLGGLTAFALIGPRYKFFSRNKSANFTD
jgi:glycosyltransferase involved in cell wall biosynthesis